MNTQKKHIPSMLVAYLFLITLCIIWVIPLILVLLRSKLNYHSNGMAILPW